MSYKRDILIKLDVGVLPAWKLFCPLDFRYLLWFLMLHFSVGEKKEEPQLLHKYLYSTSGKSSSQYFGKVWGLSSAGGRGQGVAE